MAGRISRGIQKSECRKEQAGASGDYELFDKGGAVSMVTDSD